MAIPPGRPDPRSRHFLLFLATCMGLAALSIDLLLPAFPDMREDLGLAAGSTEVSRIVTAFFLGLAAGQLVYGPLSDRYGRKRLLYAGLAVVVAAAAASAVAPSLSVLVACRFVWGFGAAAARSLGIAMIRDTFEGEAMARTMSFIMTVFVLVPVFAPSVGSLVLGVASWRAVVWLQVAIAAALAAWLVRMPETLHAEDRRPITPRALADAAGVVVRSRQSVSFGIAIAAMFGIITSYLGTAEVMIDEVFDQGDRFAVVFGAVAATLTIGSLLSARLVVRIGVDRLVRYGAFYLMATAALLAVVAWATDGRPSLLGFGLCLALLLPSVSLLIPSCNTAAMAPLGHVAGMGAAILGTLTTAGGALLGSVADAGYDGTVAPFAYHVLAYAALATVAILVLARPTGEPSPAAVAIDPVVAA